MVRLRGWTVTALFLTLALAGCIGSDDVGPQDEDLRDAEAAVATDAAGSLTGQVITVTLDHVVGSEIGAVNRTGGVTATRTDKTGHYTFNGLPPGPYRLQIEAPCCRPYTESVVVKAGQVTTANVQLELLSALDLATPYIEVNQWDGFMSCGVSTFNAPLPVCTSTADPNHDLSEDFTIEPGVQEVVMAMVWNENTLAPDAYGNALRVDLNSVDCEGCNYRYVAESTSSPIVAFINDETIADDFARWVHLNATRAMRFDVNSGHTNVFFQQAFTIYWYEFYHQRADLDFEPIPDQ